jgi:hypothetical protein
LPTPICRSPLYFAVVALSLTGTPGLPLPTAQAQTASAPATDAPKFDFYGRGPYRRDVPRPSAILGYEAGARHTTFREQEAVILAIANAAKDRVRVVDYGRSVEGRPLRLVFVSSPENIARLEEIRGGIARLADPRKTAPEDAEKIIRATPTLTWINHCIHGDETASFETAMWTLYTLAASDAPAVRGALKDSVIVLNPAFNPDGHERFVVYYNSVAVGSPESFAFEKSIPWAVRGRFNHYRFDMNRDKIAQSQPETRQETAAYLRWMPQVFVDQHGQPPTYFFPPNSLPSNAQVDRARLTKWTGVFGQAIGKAFDGYGWAYVNRETFDLFYPGYLDSFTTLTGAIGMTYETDGGGNLARRRDDDTISTLRDATAHHLESALVTIETAAKNRENLLKDFYAFRRGAIEEGGQGKLRRVVILPERDPGRAAELASLLARVGIEVREASAGFSSPSAHRYGAAEDKAEIREFPAGSLVVDFAQPQGRLARALLEPDADMEPAFVTEQQARRERNEKRNDRERTEGYEFYDITAWSLPMTFGLESYGTEDASAVNGPLLTPDASGKVSLTGLNGGVSGGRARVAYLFRLDRDNAAVLALRLLSEDFRLAAVTKPVSVGKQEWPRGTLMLRADRNPATVHARIAALAKTLNVNVTAISDSYAPADGAVGIGSDYVIALKKPRIAVVADDNVSQTGFGSVWHLLDTLDLPFTSVRLRSLNPDTLAKFNVLILPDGGGYAGALGKDGIANLKAWVGKGNVVVGLAGGGTWFADKDADLTSARPVGESEEGNKEAKDDKKPKRPTELPGAIFAANIAAAHFLGYGYPLGELLVPLSGGTFLKPSKTGTNVITFGKGPARRSGFIWPGNTEELLANTAYVIDEPVGGGHALLFLDDPTFRALWPGLRRLFLSGILFGPSL